MPSRGHAVSFYLFKERSPALQRLRTREERNVTTANYLKLPDWFDHDFSKRIYSNLGQ